MDLIKLTDAEINEHHYVIRKNFSVIAEMAGKEIGEAAFTMFAQQRAQAIDVLVGQTFSRLAQVRALRWMRKNWIKKHGTSEL